MPFRCSNCGHYFNKDHGVPYKCPACKEYGTIERCEPINKEEKTNG